METKKEIEREKAYDEIEEAKVSLKDTAKRSGYLFYTILKSVSSNGMSRHIQVIALLDNEPIDITRAIAKVLGRRLNKNSDAIVVSGCGMDMGFEVVYSVSREIFTENEAERIIQRRDSGYVIKQRWM